MQIKFRVDKMTEAEISELLNDIDDLKLESVTAPKSTSLRESSNMEPFTYFVVALSAHVTAAIVHDVIKPLIFKKFGQKRPEIVDE